MAETRGFKRICSHRVEETALLEAGSGPGTARRPPGAGCPCPCCRGRRSRGCFRPTPVGPDTCSFTVFLGALGWVLAKNLKPSCSSQGSWAGRRPVIIHPCGLTGPSSQQLFEAQDREVGEGCRVPPNISNCSAARQELKLWGVHYSTFLGQALL